MNSAAPSYRLVQTYVTLWVMGLAVASLGLYVLVPGVAGAAPEALTGLLVMGACVGGALLCLGRLVIEVHAHELRWHFGYVGWPAWSQPLAELAGTQAARTRFVWGSGIRGPRQHRFYTVSAGGPALRVHLHDDRTVTLGTPDPQRLASALHAQIRALGR